MRSSRSCPLGARELLPPLPVVRAARGFHTRPACTEFMYTVEVFGVFFRYNIIYRIICGFVCVCVLCELMFEIRAELKQPALLLSLLSSLLVADQAAYFATDYALKHILQTTIEHPNTPTPRPAVAAHYCLLMEETTLCAVCLPG